MWALRLSISKKIDKNKFRPIEIIFEITQKILIFSKKVDPLGSFMGPFNFLSINVKRNSVLIGSDWATRKLDSHNGWNINIFLKLY